MIPIFVLNDHFPVTSGAKFGSACGSPSHNPFHIVRMAHARYFFEGFLPQTSSDLYLSFGKAVFREVIRSLFTFSVAPFNSVYFLSLIAVHQLHGRRKQGNSLIKKKKSQKISQTVKRCRMHPPAMPPNFKKNGSLLHEVHVFEVCTPRYAKTHFVKVGTYRCVGSQMIFKSTSDNFSRVPCRVLRSTSYDF